MLSDRQHALITETLRVALAVAAGTGGGPAFERAASELDAPEAPPHAALPEIGASSAEVYLVREDDTATAMGHPDPSVAVLGSPRLGLWFEVTASRLLPAPSPALTHVGVGLVVHHLAAAVPGEEVTVRATIAATSGRRAAFSCSAEVGDRVVALGVHQRVLREAR